MKYIKKVLVSELETPTGTIIDSMNTGDDQTTNAPSIHAVKEYLNSGYYEFTKSLNLSTANTWYDTGIVGPNLESGTYVMEVYISSYQVNQQYGERLSGIVAWLSTSTNSSNSDEISLSKAGHARNNHVIKLRILRNPTSGAAVIKLQITDSIAWSGSGDVIFKFRKLI